MVFTPKPAEVVALEVLVEPSPDVPALTLVPVRAIAAFVPDAVSELVERPGGCDALLAVAAESAVTGSDEPVVGWDC
jgi:hypothetical protein